MIATLFVAQWAVALAGHAQPGSRHVSLVEGEVGTFSLQRDPSEAVLTRWRNACMKELVFMCQRGTFSASMFPSIGHGDRLNCPRNPDGIGRNVDFQRLNPNTFSMNVNQNGYNIPPIVPIVGWIDWAIRTTYQVSCSANCVTQCGRNCPYTDANSCQDACESEHGDCAACVESEPGCFSCESEPGCGCEFPTASACESSGCQDCVTEGDCFTCNDNKPKPPRPTRPTIPVPNGPGVPGPEGCPDGAICMGTCNGKPGRGIATLNPDTGECKCAIGCPGPENIGGGFGSSCTIYPGEVCPVFCTSCTPRLF